MRFLTARWTNLFLATYAAPEELLRPYLPPGVELDRRDGQCFVSLVAFDFHDTRVLGVPWPGFRHFPELNLRTYVRYKEQRGVLFIREFIARRFIASMANWLYNESYLVTPMRSAVTEKPERIHVEHRVELGGRTHILSATATKPGFEPKPDSVEHFFKEHEWGFGTMRGRLIRYRVDHPMWSIYPIRDWTVDIDWAMLYGPEWGVMQRAKPSSTILAAGSPVKLYTWQRLS